MASSKDNEFARQRRAEEDALIETIPYKRRCIKLAPTFPSEEEIQRKIRTILCSVIDVIQSNTVLSSFTEIRGRKPQFYAKGESTLYKSHLEKVHLEGAHITDKPRCASEALAMGYDLYGLLVLSDDTLAISKDKFFEERVKGVSLDPTFTADFVRKEIEFLEDLCHKIQTEIHETHLQTETETHESISEEIRSMLARLEKKIDERFDQFSQQQERCINRLTDLEHKVKESGDRSQSHSVKYAHSSIAVTPPLRSSEEDLLDLEDEVVFEHSELHSDGGGVDDNSNDGQRPTAEEERLELEHRLNVLKKLAESERNVPERKINRHDPMQDKDRFLRCSFCFAKGLHYSDSCPEVPLLCLDIRHETHNCPRPKRPCMYCSSLDHNKAICRLPERITITTVRSKKLSRSWNRIEIIILRLDHPEKGSITT
uniref:CCHC-type domain-containing protein n=1 Tax=Haemonchus placei TaxID=6290 RepID=A0A0N4WHA0_HAEPC